MLNYSVGPQAALASVVNTKNTVSFYHPQTSLMVACAYWKTALHICLPLELGEEIVGSIFSS